MDMVATVIGAVRGSMLLRVLLIGFLILLLQIPIAMINGLIGERAARHGEAVEEVTGKWGKEQTVLGPVLVVPYVRRTTEELEGGRRKEHSETRTASFLPETLQVSGRIDTEMRTRGIFAVPVYKATLALKGTFARPDFSEWGVKSENVLWERAELWVRISDARAIQSQTNLTWNGQEIPFAPGTGEFAGDSSGIHVPMRGRLAGRTFAFSFPLVLNGSVAAYFAPLGKETEVDLSSNWENPSFQGNWLPAERSVGPDGFRSKWVIPWLGRNFPQSWSSESSITHEIDKATFGVQLLPPIDPYRMSERSVKYEALFLLLTFMSFWLFEVLARHRLHSLQYLLVGAAMCLFFLLLLSLSEHLGFLPAYLLASVGVTGLIAGYSKAILRRAGWAATVAGLVAALYAYLYVLLKNEDYALLIGSLGLFSILAAVMYLTRKIDWGGQREGQPGRRKEVGS